MIQSRKGSETAARVVAGEGGLPCVRVETPLAEGTMYLHGGQVTSWRPAGRGEVLFVSRHARWETGRAIRGGVPVCFPWFGAHPADAAAPAHGAVRTRAWQLESIEEVDGAVTVAMSTESDQMSRRLWPSDFRLVLRATFGSTLTLELTVTNTGAESALFEAALHTYYRVEDIHHTRVRGLEGLWYLDTVEPRGEARQRGPIAFTGETDRIYLDTSGPVSIDGAERTVTIDAERAATAVVWNPWVGKSRALSDLADDEWRGFVCVETCSVSPRPVRLDAGQTHVMRAQIAVGATSRHDRDRA